MSRIKRIFLYILIAIGNVNIYVALFFKKMTFEKLMFNSVFQYGIIAFVVICLLVEAIMFLLYTKFKFSSIIRILITSVTSFSLYYILFGLMFYIKYQNAGSRGPTLLIMAIPVAVLTAIVFDQQFRKEKKDYNHKLKAFQSRHKES